MSEPTATDGHDAQGGAPGTRTAGTSGGAPRSTTSEPHRLWAIGRVLLRLQATRGRLSLAVGVTAVIGLTSAGVGTVAGDDVGGLFAVAVLGASVPLVALVLASACLGDLAEDGTLVYVWLRPVSRTGLALAAVAASAALVVPLNLLTVLVVAVAGSDLGTGLAAAAPVALVSLAYSSVFVALGLRTKRSLLWGLGYVLLLEGFLARFSDQLAALSLRHHAQALLDHAAGGVPDAGAARSITVLLVVTVAGIGVTAWWLHSRDVA